MKQLRIDICEGKTEIDQYPKGHTENENNQSVNLFYSYDANKSSPVINEYIKAKLNIIE